MMIITDTGADMMRSETDRLNVQVVPVTIHFEGEHFTENTPEAFLHFYDLLQNSKSFPTTSQPSPADYLALFEKANGDDILVITLSSGLSGTYNSANLAKDMCDADNIYIVDSKQAIVTQRILVERAAAMRDAGATAREIVAELEDLRERVEVCGALSTLTYLKKGGRIPASLATIGNILGIKPTIALLDSSLVNIGKGRSLKAAKDILWREYDACEIDTDYPICFGYTLNASPAEEFQAEARASRNITNTRMIPVGGTIGAHVGPGAILIAFVAKKAIKEYKR